MTEPTVELLDDGNVRLGFPRGGQTEYRDVSVDEAVLLDEKLHDALGEHYASQTSSNEAGQSAVGAVIVIAIIIAVIVGVGYLMFSEKVDRGNVGLRYSGGVEQGEKYIDTVEPGSDRFFNGWGNKFYQYPTTNRNYIISDEAEGDEKAPDHVTTSSSDGVPVSFEMAIQFRLNEKNIREFHEKFDPKYKVHTEEGWDEYLRQEFRQNIQSSLQNATIDYSAVDIYTDGDVRQKIEAAFEKELTERQKGYFCGPDGDGCSNIVMSIKGVSVPGNIRKALEANQIAAQQKQKAVFEAETALTKARGAAAAKAEEAKAIKTLDAALRDAGTGYLELQRIEAMTIAAQNGQTQFWVVPTGTDVSMLARKAG